MLFRSCRPASRWSRKRSAISTRDAVVKTGDRVGERYMYVSRRGTVKLGLTAEEPALRGARAWRRASGPCRPNPGIDKAERDLDAGRQAHVGHHVNAKIAKNLADVRSKERAPSRALEIGKRVNARSQRRHRPRDGAARPDRRSASAGLRQPGTHVHITSSTRACSATVSSPGCVLDQSRSRP